MGLSLRIRARLRFARQYFADPERLVAPRRRPGTALSTSLASVLFRSERQPLARRLFCLLLARSRACRGAATAAPRAMRRGGRLLLGVVLVLLSRLRSRERRTNARLSKRFCPVLRRVAQARARLLLRTALIRSGRVDRHLSLPLRHRIVAKRAMAPRALSLRRRRVAVRPRPVKGRVPPTGLACRRPLAQGAAFRQARRAPFWRRLRRMLVAIRKTRRTLRDLVRRRGRRHTALSAVAVHNMVQLPRGVRLVRRLSFRGWFRAYLHKLCRHPRAAGFEPRRQGFPAALLATTAPPLLARLARQRQLNACVKRHQQLCALRFQRRELRFTALRASVRVLAALRVLVTRPWTAAAATRGRPLLWHGLLSLLTPALSSVLSRSALFESCGAPRLPGAHLRARSPRTLKAFLFRLRRRYGYRRKRPPFRLDVSAKSRRSRRQPTERLETYRLLKTVRRFYGQLTQPRLWRERRTTVRGRGGTAAFRSLLLFESRLDVFLLRARWCVSLADARQVIHAGWVCVNGQASFSYRSVVGLQDTVSVRPAHRALFRRRLLTHWAWAVRTPGAVLERLFPFYLEFNPRPLALAYVPALVDLLASPTAMRFSKSILTNWGRYAY